MKICPLVFLALQATLACASLFELPPHQAQLIHVSSHCPCTLSYELFSHTSSFVFYLTPDQLTVEAVRSQKPFVYYPQYSSPPPGASNFSLHQPQQVAAESLYIILVNPHDTPVPVYLYMIVRETGSATESVGRNQELEHLRLLRAAILDTYATSCADLRSIQLSTPRRVGQDPSLLRNLSKTFGIQRFVETGTYKGFTVASLISDFNVLYSIEPDPQLHASNLQLFEAFPHVRLVNADSSSGLPDILAELDGPALFWLDGHWSGPSSPRLSKMDTPVMAELRSIFSWGFAAQSVIVIDDARLFTGYDVCQRDSNIACYPRLEDVALLVCLLAPQMTIHIHDDCIVVTPRV
mmetsp:Transcript_5216/g.8985  ORF Transcript_5216/g.8985 Transcript_5216/m.8985 type:complete len:351 (-) Transcript_5216:356-1408(-)|eukprot:CAMPEP_0196658254 /NCGR_PEP_ID=MMETSP1086-20130531/28444_1 /TAXON_ID=77921 /ORGANISM="Cyanoptyche  gloeocystis , Strain SAG4.97" /LENGTH=350 /DNA_ID=CAMNT_0041991733 /DNA_START=145 /DNA_END=1197 /DNA_ORIENTATION=+